MSKLVYRVYPIPPSMKTYVWNFGYLTPTDEAQYIAVMTETTWNSTEITNGVDANTNAFSILMSAFTNIIAASQIFLRKYLFDTSVCSLRDVARCNELFKWFFNRPRRQLQRRRSGGIRAFSKRHLQESMMLALAQCYHYRLNEKLRALYEQLIRKQLIKYDVECDFKNTIVDEQDYLVDKVKIPDGIALNRAFKENLFVMLVGIATKTPTVIVGKPGSSKTLALVTLQDNLSSAQKNPRLTANGFHNYWVIPFQCSKLTEAKAISDKWEYALQYRDLMGQNSSGTLNDQTNKTENRVIFFLDEVGLAEQSPYRPLKVLHKLLEHPTISFIGLSNWKLDAAKMNRCILHNVLPPNDNDLQTTALIIMQGGDEFTQHMQNELQPKIPKIANIYKSIIESQTDNLFKFDFYGHRDFYSLVSYLKLRLQETDLTDDMVLIEAVMRNFGGINKSLTEKFLFPRIAKYILKEEQAELDEKQVDDIWERFSALELIRNNVQQTRLKRKRNTTCQLRNIMMITDNTALFKILFNSRILNLNETNATVDSSGWLIHKIKKDRQTTNVIFGSAFKEDRNSSVYLYRTIDKVRTSMLRGDCIVLLKLEQLYDSLYDVLNQRYLTIDDQKFCKICIGGESINCKINPKFKIIVVVPTEEAYHQCANTDNYTPTAFLNRFEKAYVDIDLLQTIGFGSKHTWEEKLRSLQRKISVQFQDHASHIHKGLFVGYRKSNAIMSKITLLLSCDDNKTDTETVINECYKQLIKTTSLQYLIHDRRKGRVRDNFTGYAHLIDLIKREGVLDQHRDKNHKLLRIVTYDTYQMPADFHGNGMNVFDSFDTKEDNIDNEAINAKFKELNEFNREKDFYDYILSFLDNNSTAVSTLIIICDPIPNNNEQETILTHYLHAQYLIEKACSQSVSPNRRRANKEEKNTAKNVAFLIYMTRTNPYPLLFNQNWSHLYCDALSIDNHTLSPEIQINDINIFDSDGKNKLLERVIQHSGRIVKNNYIAALNKIDLSTGLHKELEKFKRLLEKPGKFYQILIQRISKVLEDPKTGAEQCILSTFNQILSKSNKPKSKNQAKLANRGSFRSLVMQQLGKKIESELVHVLSIIFSNHNSKLYLVKKKKKNHSDYDIVDVVGQLEENKYDDDVSDEENADEKLKTKLELVNELWLDLLSEPQIVRFKAQSYGTKFNDAKTPIDNNIKAKFPFSSHIHDYFMSLKKSVISNYHNKTVPIDESGLFGQRFLLKELSQRLNDANMKFPITNLSETFVNDLLSDIVKLQSIQLGIKHTKKEQIRINVKATHSEELYNSIVIFLWQISLKLHEEYLGIKRKQKQQKIKLQKQRSIVDELNADVSMESIEQNQDIDIDELSETEIDLEDDDDDDDDDSESDNENQDHKKTKAIKADDADKIEEQTYKEELTVQVHEIYASIWANQRITFQFIDVLSCINSVYLKTINKVWENQRMDFIDCFGQIMQKVLKQLKELLINLRAQDLKLKADQILSIVGSFEGIFEYLQKMGYDETNTLIVNWKRIHLSLICTSVCVVDKKNNNKLIDGQFVSDLYNRFQTFDNIEDLKWLISEIKLKLESNQITKPKTNDLLQYLYQRFVTEFAFTKQSATNNEQQRNTFLQTLIDCCSEEENKNDDEIKTEDESKNKNAIAVKLNSFSKFQTLSKILTLTRPKKSKKIVLFDEMENKEETDEQKEYKNEEKQQVVENENKYDEDAENVINKLSIAVSESLDAGQKNIDECPLALLVLSCEEQHLYYKYKKDNEGKQITKIPLKFVKSVVKRLDESLNETKLKQLLAIAEAKLIIYYFVRYISKLLRSRKAELTNKALKYGNKTPIKKKYFQAFGKLFAFPEKSKNAYVISMKRGLQYFMVCALWNSVLGPSRTILLTKSDVFTKILQININYEEVKDDVDNKEDTIPKDNPFLLLSTGDDEKVFSHLEGAMEQKEKLIWTYDEKYIVFMIGSLFNHGYINKGVGNDQLSKLLPVNASIAKQIVQYQMNDNDDNEQWKTKCKRTEQLLTSLTCNSMEWPLRFTDQTLEEIQVIRMMFHFIGVVLSLPKNPFSILFHDPILYNNGYLIGMPPDQMSLLFKSMAPSDDSYWGKTGVMLCPNNHIYFLQDCSYPYETYKCQECDAEIGGSGHIAAVGNKRVGYINKQGQLIVDVVEDGKDKYGNEMGTYNAEEASPKGYVDCDTATDVCRNMTNVQVRIVRIFVNIILLMHHCSDKELTKLNHIDILNKNCPEYSDISKFLMNYVQKYVNEFRKEIGVQSNEDVLYILHNIINDFYIKYPAWYLQKENQTVNNISSQKERLKFEEFLINECIDSTIKNIAQSIQNVRAKCSNNMLRYWSSRISETIDLQTTDGYKFAETFRPNLYLQTKFISLYQFRTIILNKENKNKIKQLYPVTYGILQCIDTDIGYSVFAVKYIPYMISWMQNIKSKLNQRLDMQQIVHKSEKYNGQWVLNQCKKHGWGDPDEWEQSLNGFVLGWNHVANRVKTQKGKGTIERQNKIKDHEDGKDDEKYEIPKDEDIDEIVKEKNPLKKFVVLQDVCQALTILKIEPKGDDPKAEIKPIDVPLIFALDSKSEDFTVSKMISFMLDHLITANNRLLRMCYNLNSKDNGESIGLSPRLSTRDLSQQRENDVVNLSEEELTSIIQQCSHARLRYGEDNELNLHSFNLRLLETQLRQKYIVGRKLLKYDRIIFEFAGQHNIPKIINNINEKYKQAQKKKSYFMEISNIDVIEQDLILLKFAIEQNCEHIDDEQMDDDDDDDEMIYDNINEIENREEKAKENKMRGYKISIGAVEQTLVAIERLFNPDQKELSPYPDPSTNLISEYMKNTLHLYSQDYMAFQQTKLKLQHIPIVWRYLEKLLVLCEGNWTQIPVTVMNCYMKSISDNQHTNIKQVITKYDTKQLWEFLTAMRRFLKEMCKEELTKHTDEHLLYIYLKDAEDMEYHEDILIQFCSDLKLSQIGVAYEKAAESYRILLEEQQ